MFDTHYKSFPVSVIGCEAVSVRRSPSLSGAKWLLGKLGCRFISTAFDVELWIIELFSGWLAVCDSTWICMYCDIV